MDAEFQDRWAIPGVDALDTCAHVGAHAVVRGFRATLSARRTSLAGLEYLRPADPSADPQFHFPREHQFQRDYRHPPVFMGWADGLDSGRNSESVGYS